MTRRAVPDLATSIARMSVKGKVIRASGEIEDIPTTGRGSMRVIQSMIGAHTCDTVVLRHLGQPWLVMVVDDNGYETKVVEEGNQITLVPTRALRPVNEIATELYWANCQPGTTHQIVGDVAIVSDEDFAS